MNIIYKNSGDIIAWGTAVKNPNKDGIHFKKDVEIPNNFNGINYLYINDEWIVVEYLEENSDNGEEENI
jgi:hypothetical protein